MTRHRHYGSLNRHSDGIVRNCSRCGLELTDAASREHGVGPICRRKTNDLHARQIPANLNVASALFLSLKKTDFDENCPGFASTKRMFVRRMAALASQNDTLTAVTLVGADFRKIVDWFDVALSYNIKRSVRKTLIDIIDALGYVGLASVLRGDACMSPATLMVVDGTIKLSGKSCKAGYFAMRREIPGVRFPRYRGDSTPYTASAAHAEKFVEIAVRHWPFIDCDTAVVLADAAKAVAKGVATNASSTSYPPSMVAHFTAIDGRGNFQVKTPWTGTREAMTAMLDRFKALPRDERKYLPNRQMWSFAGRHLDTVKAIVAERYQVRCA